MLSIYLIFTPEKQMRVKDLIKCFRNDIYEDETEKLFAHIESRVANVIDQKILKHDTITLTRKELLLLKRYMLILENIRKKWYNVNTKDEGVKNQNGLKKSN